MDPDLLAVIERTYKDAAFGYTAVSPELYRRHVNALLAERRDLLARLAELEQAAEANRDDGR